MGDLLIQKIVPAEECERFASALTGREYRCDPSKLYTISVRRHPVSEQHQGEPVGMLLIEEYFDNREVGEVDVQLDSKVCEQLAEKYPGRSLPLYTHADPGEVERLRAQLAERDALLHDTRLCIERNDYPVFELLKRIDTALSASAEPSAPDGLEPRECRKCGSLTAEKCKAGGCWFEREPSAPVECDERAEFDPIEWLETEIIAVDTWYRGSPSYEHDAGWMKDQALRLVAEARAALERKP